MLNFDPHKWIADHKNESLAELAELAGMRGEFDDSKLQVPAANLAKPANSNRLLKHWHGKLKALCYAPAPAGLSPIYWSVLRDSSCWLYEGFAGQAVRDGWTALDLFGLRAGMPGLGGLADQLQGARSLKMADGAAVWSSWSVTSRTARGCGEGLSLLWERTR